MLLGILHLLHIMYVQNIWCYHTLKLNQPLHTFCFVIKNLIILRTSWNISTSVFYLIEDTWECHALH